MCKPADILPTLPLPATAQYVARSQYLLDQLTRTDTCTLSYGDLEHLLTVGIVPHSLLFPLCMLTLCECAGCNWECVPRFPILHNRASSLHHAHAFQSSCPGDDHEEDG